MKFRVPLKRQSADFAFYGNKDSGKTIAMTFFGLWFAVMRNLPIYANFHLKNLPHVFVKSIHQVKNMRRCVFLGDDFENWASSKFLSNKEKKDLLEFTLQFGKRNIPFLWSCKFPSEIDKTLRRTLDYFVRCNMVLKFVPRSKAEYNYMSSFLDAHVVVMDVINPVTLKTEQTAILDNLSFYGQFYDTQEEIKDLEK